MKKIKKVLELTNYNKSALIRFELIFKLLSVLLFTPIFLKSFTMIMQITGYNYITIENVIPFLLSPLTLIMLVILLLLMTIYTMFDITTIIVILDASYQKIKIRVVDAMRISLNKCWKIFRLKNLPLTFLVIFLIPFLHLGISSSFISTIKIPEFISDFIFNNRLLFILFIMLCIFLIFILLRWIYSIHYYVLEDMNFKEARKKSIALSSKNHFKDLITLFLVQLAIFVIYFIFIIIGILLILLFNKIFDNHLILKSMTSTLIWLYLAFSYIFISLLSTPISYASISVMYYFHKENKKEKIHNLKIENITKKNKLAIRVLIIISIVSLILGTIFTYGLYKGKYNLNIEFMRNIEITAHRGASFQYPENTMSAFVGAKSLGADWIELDVQQTKDGKIIVSHDTNLFRVTGVNKNIIDLNYDEIKDLDAGSFFSTDFKDERIPLFADVVKWAKENNMKLNVELKPTGLEHDFEASVINIMKEYNYEDNCVLTSQVYYVLENAKAYDKDITTVYVMSLAVGNVLLFDKADYFSIEASNINSSLVKKIHNSGKELYAWTINTEDNIKKMIDLNVDNIITDNITLTKDIVSKSRTSNLVNEFVKLVEKYF